MVLFGPMPIEGMSILAGVAPGGDCSDYEGSDYREMAVMETR